MPLQFTNNSQGGGSLSFSANRAVLSAVGLVEASQAEAEAGAVLGVYMSPLRVAQAVEAGLFFTQTGTGATPRSIASKFKDTALTPYDFGAVGNGSTDDSVAMAALVTAALAQNKAIYLSKGSFKYSSTLAFTKMIPIFGDGVDQSSLVYTGAGVGMSFTPPTNASSNTFHFMHDFTVTPSVAGGGTVGIHVQLQSGANAYYSHFNWDRVLCGGFGGRSVWLDNTVGNTDGIFLGTIRRCVFQNGFLATQVGDSVVFRENNIQGTNEFTISMISGARALTIEDNNITTAGGIVLSPVYGCRVHNNQIEIFSGVNYGGATTALLYFGSVGSQITVTKNRITKLGTGTKPDHTVFFDSTVSYAFADENEIDIGNTSHIKGGASTDNIRVGYKDKYNTTAVVTLSGTNSTREWPDGFTTVGDADYTILKTDRIVGTSAALTTTRTWTLPAASSVNKGQRLIVSDTAGGVTSVNTLVIARAGADTISGGTSVTFALAGLGMELFSNGADAWNYSKVSAFALANNSIANAKLADMAAATFKMRALGAGTGAPIDGTATQARTALALVPGTDVQAWDADLDAIAALTGTNTIYYRSAANTWTNVTISATLSFSGGSLALNLTNANSWSALQTFTTATSGGIPLVAESTNTDAVAGPLVQVDRNSASPAAADNIGQFIFTGRDSNANVTTYGGLSCTIIDPTDTSEDSRFSIQTMLAGAQGNRVHVAAGLMVGTTTDPGTGLINTNSATFMIGSKTAYTNGAGALTGTLTNSPATGNPTKWIPVDDNGTTRYIPAW